MNNIFGTMNNENNEHELRKGGSIFIVYHNFQLKSKKEIRKGEIKKYQKNN